MSVAYQTTKLLVKVQEMVKMMTVHLNHFPNHEKFALSQEIRRAAYDVFQSIVAAQKGYSTLEDLKQTDVRVEQLRMLVNLAHEIGYYHYKNGKRDQTDEVAFQRYTALSSLINEVGAMIGTWLTRLHKEKCGGERLKHLSNLPFQVLAHKFRSAVNPSAPVLLCQSLIRDTIHFAPILRVSSNTIPGYYDTPALVS